MTKGKAAIGAIWALALVAAGAIALLIEQERQLTVITITMLGLFLAAGAIQLAIAPTSGFIRRMTFSTVGALAILAVASLVMGLLGAGGAVLHG